MNIAYFDCFSGICGDMILGALFDLGLNQDFFRSELEKIDLLGYSIEIKKVMDNNICATDVYIKTIDDQPSRSFLDIKDLIYSSSLDENIKDSCVKIFLKIAKAEGKIHNIRFEDVHFHEIGAVDSIIDIVGSVIGIHNLGFDKIYCSPLPLGTGFVKCSHGKIPIPAPATVEILKNIPVYQTKRKQELITPTGAGIISSISKDFGKMPPINIKKIGYGAGKKKSNYPNLLRVFVGELIKIKKK